MTPLFLAALLTLQAPPANVEIPPTAEIGPAPTAREFGAPALPPHGQDTEFPPRLYEPRPGTPSDPFRFGTNSNYGIATGHMGDGPKIRASDPETLARVNEEQRKRPCPGPGPCPNPAPAPRTPEGPDVEKPRPPGPVKRIENGISLGIAVAAAAFLILGGLILATRSKSA
jgi:hypothetical protein